MATLKHLKSKQIRPVPARLLVGRSATSALRIKDPHVSGEHATLIWTGGRWEVRDLGSRNGTFVDGDRLEPGDAEVVEKGAVIGFGHQDHMWELVDDGPPSAIAEAMHTGEIRVAEDGMLALPNPDEPQVIVYGDARGNWIIELPDGSAHAVEDGEVIQCGDTTWQIRTPSTIEGTAAVDSGPSIETMSIRFAVSANEEHVEVTVIHRGKEIALEPREHGYVLLTLARKRVEDAELAEAEQGWIDRDLLLKMLGVDGNALNVAIYRARGQLGAAGVDGAAGVVEVRRGSRRFGLEPSRIELTTL